MFRVEGVEELCGHFYFLCERTGQALAWAGGRLQKGSAGGQKVLAGRQRGLAVGGEDREDWKGSREGWGWGPGGREKKLLRGEQREAGSKIRLSWSQLAR